jgi:hypothetical protein
MTFTDQQLEILYRAKILGLDYGQVLEGWAYPDAHELAEAGWLQRRFQPDGELAWFWTPQAETTLDLTALLQSTEGREN